MCREAEASPQRLTLAIRELGKRIQTALKSSSANGICAIIRRTPKNARELLERAENGLNPFADLMLELI